MNQESLQIKRWMESFKFNSRNSKVLNRLHNRLQMLYFWPIPVDQYRKSSENESLNIFLRFKYFLLGDSRKVWGLFFILKVNQDFIDVNVKFLDVFSVPDSGLNLKRLKVIHNFVILLVHSIVII